MLPINLGSRSIVALPCSRSFLLRPPVQLLPLKQDYYEEADERLTADTSVPENGVVHNLGVVNTP
jgi:hypothetical protein